MKFLQQLLDENVTSAHAIAGAQGSLFGGGVVRRSKPMADAYRLDPSTIKKHKSNFQWRVIGEMMDSSLKGQSPESTFDPADVMSKLRDAEKQVDTEEDTVAFGMEDEDGQVVKVYVRSEQADEFESALASMLAGEDDEGDDDDVTDESEIAEVLFKLKDKFDIVDVQWPEIEGDEEEEAPMPPPAEGGMEGGAEGEMPAGEGDMEGGEGMDMEGGEMGDELDLEGGEEGGEGEDEMDMEAEGGAETTLQQVIDMMKADAESRTAEANARAAEAEARTAEANANAASSKVKQEEQVLDAEAYEKDQKAQKTEVDNLAKIARMKHDQVGKAEASLAAEEDEEERIRNINQFRGTREETPQKLAARLLHLLRGNI